MKKHNIQCKNLDSGSWFETKEIFVKANVIKKSIVLIGMKMREQC